MTCKTLVGIPFVNRVDLLERAIACVPDDIGVMIQNNSGLPDPELKRPVFRPHVMAMSYSQSMNLFQQEADRQGYPFWLFMHSDGMAQRQDFERLVSLAEKCLSEGRKWAVIYTCYDVLACYSTEALNSIGGWDTTFPNYFSDNHNYRKLRLAGFEMLQLENHTVEHGVDGKGSQTINSDTILRRTNEILFPAYAQLYREMWGGAPGGETFITPWNK